MADADQPRRRYYCETCQKGYARIQELQSHEASYEHTHNLRRAQLQATTRTLTGYASGANKKSKPDPNMRPITNIDSKKSGKAQRVKNPLAGSSDEDEGPVGHAGGQKGEGGEVVGGGGARPAETGTGIKIKMTGRFVKTGLTGSLNKSKGGKELSAAEAQLKKAKAEREAMMDEEWVGCVEIEGPSVADLGVPKRKDAAEDVLLGYDVGKPMFDGGPWKDSDGIIYVDEEDSDDDGPVIDLRPQTD